MTVNNTPYIGCTRLANACKLLLFEKPIAIIPKSGNPTPVIANPNAAINSLVPEYCPNSAGNIKFPAPKKRDRKSTRLNSSHVAISYAVFCLKKKKKIQSNIYSYPTYIELIQRTQ